MFPMSVMMCHSIFAMLSIYAALFLSSFTGRVSPSLGKSVYSLT